jgi:hypothetical protein
MIVAHEWYREFLKAKAKGLARDFEADAEQAHAVDEIIYE